MAAKYFPLANNFKVCSVDSWSHNKQAPAPTVTDYHTAPLFHGIALFVAAHSVLSSCRLLVSTQQAGWQVSTALVTGMLYLT